MNIIFLISLLFYFPVFATTTLNKSSHNSSSSSLIQLYFHNSEMQRQWAWELLGKQRLEVTEEILDFGCGDGKISATMSLVVPKGSVTAVDISPVALAFANTKFPRYAYSNLEFKLTHSLIFDDMSAQRKFDIITSFNVLHQVPYPLDLLKNFKVHLKPTGKVVFVIPAGKNPAFFQAAEEMFEKFRLQTPWKQNIFASNTISMRTLEGCAHLLEQAGYTIVDLEMIDTHNPFYNKVELISWMIGTTAMNWNIPHALSYTFFKELVDRMHQLDPKIIDLDGRIRFKLSRIHVVAVPNF